MINMRVLITGGTGTISTGLVKECVNRGFETYAFTRGNKKNRNIPGANYLYGDIWDMNSVAKVLENRTFDVVVECLVYNVEQLKTSLKHFANRCSQYVFISTAGVYERKGEERITESDEKNFVQWSYTKNKIECEKYLLNYSREHNLIYTIIRPTVTYGDYRIPFPIATRNPGWTFFQRMIDGKPILASDNVKFSVIHIDDFSRAVVGLFKNEKAYNEDFHITDRKNDIFWDDVVKIAGNVLNVDPQIVHVNKEIIRKAFPQIYDEIVYNKNRSLLFDDAKLKNVVRFSAEINIQEGIKRIITSMKDEFEENNLSLDDKWNDFCNYTLLVAHNERALSDAELNMVTPHLKELRKSMWNLRIRKTGNTIIRLNCRLKKIIRRKS